MGETLRALNRPFVVGGDFNMSPSELKDSGWVQAIGGAVISPGAWTCRKGKDEVDGSEIDFFVVDGQLAPWATSYPVDCLSTRPHRGIMLELAIPAGESFKHRQVRTPVPFPNERPMGPPMAPPTTRKRPKVLPSRWTLMLSSAW